MLDVIDGKLTVRLDVIRPSVVGEIDSFLAISRAE
jgi:hypothetical protein